jgi:hypothetical protein
MFMERHSQNAMVVSLITSGVTGDWHWFARSGSLVTVGGLIMSSRAVLRKSIFDDTFIELGLTDEHQIEERERRNRDRDLAFSKIGLAYVFFGTIIWGYGDLLGELVRK